MSRDFDLKASQPNFGLMKMTNVSSEAVGLFHTCVYRKSQLSSTFHEMMFRVNAFLR